MKLNKLLIVLVVYSFEILTSCNSEYINDGRVVCFEQEVQPLINSSCTQSECHNDIDKRARLDYTSYQGILKSVVPGSYSKSKLYDAITSPFSPMPPKPYEKFTKDQIITIALWIEQGAKTNVACKTESCDTTYVTFSGTVKPILDLYCIGCHNGNNAQTSINYNTFAGVKSNVADGKLLGSIKREVGTVFMPKNGNKLSDCKIAEIQKWVEEGAPNN